MPELQARSRFVSRSWATSSWDAWRLWGVPRLGIVLTRYPRRQPGKPLAKHLQINLKFTVLLVCSVDSAPWLYEMLLQVPLQHSILLGLVLKASARRGVLGRDQILRPSELRDEVAAATLSYPSRWTLSSREPYRIYFLSYLSRTLSLFWSEVNRTSSTVWPSVRYKHGDCSRSSEDAAFSCRYPGPPWAVARMLCVSCTT